jgi:hypothetical protein
MSDKNYLTKLKRISGLKSSSGNKKRSPSLTLKKKGGSNERLN